MQAFFRYTFVLGCLDIPKYKEDVQNFVLSGTKLFDIYPEDKKQRQIMEEKKQVKNERVGKKFMRTKRIRASSGAQEKKKKIDKDR